MTPDELSRMAASGSRTPPTSPDHLSHSSRNGSDSGLTATNATSVPRSIPAPQATESQIPHAGPSHYISGTPDEGLWKRGTSGRISEVTERSDPEDERKEGHNSGSSSTGTHTVSESTNGNSVRPSLNTLPRNCLSLIAYYMIASGSPSPTTAPADTTQSSSSEQQSRANRVPVGPPASPPSILIPILLTSKTLHAALSFDSNPQLYHDLYCLTFDHTALRRRFKWMSRHVAGQSGGKKKAFDLFGDPRSWAVDYQTRWQLSKRMKKVVEDGSCGLKQGTEEESEETKQDMMADLWNIWFLLTENDGKNVPFLADHCNLTDWIIIYYKDVLLADSLAPGYPEETSDRALGTWCALISGTDVHCEQTTAEVDEKIFTFRPYVFACAKYDITYAPWHHRQLPLCPPTCTCVKHTDPTIRSKAIPYKRFGYTWRRAPPHFVLGAYLVFLRLLERQPDRLGSGSGFASFDTGTAGDPNSRYSASTAHARASSGLFSTARIMPSIYHDREWQRNSVCQDPHTSPGLPPLTFRGELEGFWRGKLLFYDFESYRGILAGDIRAVYTGTFAEDVAEFDIRETVVRVKKEQIGGEGPLLFAGFKPLLNGDDEEAEEEQRRIRQGYGHDVVIPQDEGVEDEAGWTKEILLSGRARSKWGWARIRGRVRSWDGLIILHISYLGRNSMGSWLWRAYLHTGGYFIGRWRDTFTPEHLRGFEGAIAMVRAGDIFYPPHFPQRMADSLGVYGAPPGIVPTTGGNDNAYGPFAHLGYYQAIPQHPPQGYAPPAAASAPPLGPGSTQPPVPVQRVPCQQPHMPPSRTWAEHEHQDHHTRPTSSHQASFTDRRVPYPTRSRPSTAPSTSNSPYSVPFGPPPPSFATQTAIGHHTMQGQQMRTTLDGMTTTSSHAYPAPPNFSEHDYLYYTHGARGPRVSMGGWSISSTGSEDRANLVTPISGSRPTDGFASGFGFRSEHNGEVELPDPSTVGTRSDSRYDELELRRQSVTEAVGRDDTPRQEQTGEEASEVALGKRRERSPDVETNEPDRRYRYPKV